MYNIKFIPGDLEQSKKVEDEFPIGTSIYMLSNPYFGSEGKVIDPLLVYECGRIKGEPIKTDSKFKIEINKFSFSMHNRVTRAKPD